MGNNLKNKRTYTLRSGEDHISNRYSKILDESVLEKAILEQQLDN